MVVDELGLEESQKPCATFAELNRHLESALPEVYLNDIYKYLRDCEVVLRFALLNFECLSKKCLILIRNAIGPSLIT